MLEKIGNNNIFQITLIPFILNIISKINDNSFINIVLRGKNRPFIILYFSSIFSSLILNLFFILIGLSLRYFIKTDILNNFFLLIVFFLYGFIALIQACRVFSNKAEEENKLIDYVLDSSSDDESEKPRIHIDNDKNEVEIELDTIKLDEIDDERKNNNFNRIRKKNEINKNKLLRSDNNFYNFFECVKMIVSAEIGDKMQIFNMGLASNLMDINYLIIGNACGIIIINAIIIIFGIKIIKKRINNFFFLLEAIFYLGLASFYIDNIYFFIGSPLF